MNASSKNSAVGSPSETKPAFEDEGNSTLPNPCGVEVQNALPQGSVMWDGPFTSGKGARSAVPHHQGTTTSFAAGGMSNSPTAMREVNLGMAPAHPDAKHKSAEIPNANWGSSSKAGFVSDMALDSANDRLFYVTPLNLDALRKLITQIKSVPQEHAAAWVRLRILIDAMKVKGTYLEASSQLNVERTMAVLSQISKTIKDRKQQRKERKDAEPSRETVDGYERDYALLSQRRLHVADQPPEIAWQTVMSQHAANSSTFYTYRAALVWQAQSYLKELLVISKEFDSQSCQDVLATLFPYIEHAYEELRVRSSLDHALCLQMAGEPVRKKNSRSKDLAYLPDGWRDRFLDYCANSPTYRDASVLLRFCGMRPCELKKGVQITLRDDKVFVHVLGGKQGETRGQPWRELSLDAQMMPQWFLEGFADHPTRIIQANPDSMRAYLSSLTQRVLQGAKNSKGELINLSAYLFRHAIATDVRQDGGKSDEVSAVLGHRSANTAGHYGTYTKAKGKKRNAMDKNSVRTALAVTPADTTGLQDLQHKKARKNLHQKPS
jgi:hypothetical protein